VLDNRQVQRISTTCRRKPRYVAGTLAANTVSLQVKFLGRAYFRDEVPQRQGRNLAICNLIARDSHQERYFHICGEEVIPIHVMASSYVLTSRFSAASRCTGTSGHHEVGEREKTVNDGFVRQIISRWIADWPDLLQLLKVV